MMCGGADEAYVAKLITPTFILLTAYLWPKDDSGQDGESGLAQARSTLAPFFASLVASRHHRLRMTSSGRVGFQGFETRAIICFLDERCFPVNDE